MDRKSLIELSRRIHGKEEGKLSPSSSFEERLLNLVFQLYLQKLQKQTSSREEAAKWAWEAFDIFMERMPGNDKSNC